MALIFECYRRVRNSEGDGAMSILNDRAVTALQRVSALTPDDLAWYRNVAYWKFITGALFFSACSLLPTLLQS